MTDAADGRLTSAPEDAAPEDDNAAEVPADTTAAPEDDNTAEVPADTTAAPEDVDTTEAVLTTGTGTEAAAFLDGNALAGPLSAVFAVDVTVAFFVCVGCGRRDRVAALRVYDAGLGSVARCAGCDHVVLRCASTPAGHWLDLRGTAALQIPPPAPPPASA